MHKNISSIKFFGFDFYMIFTGKARVYLCLSVIRGGTGS